MLKEHDDKTRQIPISRKLPSPNSFVPFTEFTFWPQKAQDYHFSHSSGIFLSGHEVRFGKVSSPDSEMPRHQNSRNGTCWERSPALV